MTERSTVAQVSQIGLEGTPGTAVAATRRLGSLSMSPSIQAEAEMFRPEGMKFATVQALNKEWVEVDLEGSPTYEEVIIPLSGAVNSATVTEITLEGSATGVQEWVFTPDSSDADTPKTFTLERGQAGVQVERIAHLLFTAFGLEVSRSGVTLSGSAFGKRLEKGVTATPGLETPTALTPIIPGQFSVFMRDPANDLGILGDPSTRLTRVVSANPGIEDRYNPAWFVNADEDSFTTWVENADGAGGTLDLTVEADAKGMSLLDYIRTGDTLHVRLEAQGPVLFSHENPAESIRNLFRWDMAVKVEGVDSWSDEDGIYAIPWTLRPVHDADLGYAHQITVRNTVASI